MTVNELIRKLQDLDDGDRQVFVMAGENATVRLKSVEVDIKKDAVDSDFDEWIVILKN